MQKVHRATVLPFVLSLIFSSGLVSPTTVTRAASPTDAQRQRALPAATHLEARKDAAPAHGNAVTVNPPALLWPVRSGRDVRYKVRLSQDRDFPANATITAQRLRWAMFNAHQQLNSGTWYWQYAVVRKPGEKAEWSERFAFRINDGVRAFVTPVAAKMIAACPTSHPRVLATEANLPALRREAKQTGEAKRLLDAARRYVGRPLPDLDKAHPKEKGRDTFESKNFAKWASKAFAANLLGPVRLLVRAYVVTGDPQIGDDAVRRGVFVARLDPDGVTSRRVSDFADGSCMEAMGLVYDCCYDRIPETDRALMRQAMTVRAGRLFDRCMNSLESRVFSAHIWQHILLQGTQVAFALLGEVPEAGTWAQYVYELWIARFPTLGGADGGWANGLNYFGTNFHTIEELPKLFGRLTGVDFLQHPWYRNAVYYQLYCWPPGSASDGFGDGGERGSEPSASRGQFVQALGTRFRDSYALWYAQQVLGDRYEPPSAEPGSIPSPKPPTDLPQARVFPDIGIVSMHTQLGNTAEDLMIGFRSSPYGTYNHMHCDQNSFHVLFAGDRVFANSGYYISYGDDHFKEWYIHTRGQNSVLIDGHGQVRGAEGYGWIARYLHGQRITYCLGDASAAYGDAGLTTFRRHLVFLRPDKLVVYDELEADHPARWSWLLHSKSPIRAERQRLMARSLTARSQVDLWATTPLKVAVGTQFDPPAINWRKRTSGGRLMEYRDQWHVTAAPDEPVRSLRLLAVLQIRSVGARDPFALPGTHDQTVDIGSWTIQAELDPTRPASLRIESRDHQQLLATDLPSVRLDSHEYGLSNAAAILVEDSGALIRRCQERTPSQQ